MSRLSRSRSTLFYVLAALAFLGTVKAADITDDFSQGGWELFPTTPGKIDVKKGSLTLAVTNTDHQWITASRVIEVNLDQNPIFLVDVAEGSYRGSVKLIRKDTRDKQEVVNIEGPGLYAIDLGSRFKWTGTTQIEVCLYAFGQGQSITYQQVRFVEILSDQDKTRIAARTPPADITMKELPTFHVEPLFNTCSVYYTHSKELSKTPITRFREKEGAWQTAFPLIHFPKSSMYRGSIVNLKENTEYDLELLDADGKILQQTTFRTWNSEVPIARTITLSQKDVVNGQLFIQESGTPDGWIRYTAPDGVVLQGGPKSPMISLQNKKYILLEGLTLRGSEGMQSVIVLDQCEHVRIVNCDIAHWGRLGTQRFDLDGKFYLDKNRAVNWDAAIRIGKSIGTVVERCWIHDAISAANSWYYSHPAGPEAVGIDKPRSTVLRYNDFVGSDKHRWNDVVEGTGNYHSDGGFNRDADIYGSFHCFANDDAIEIDGGQNNVRVFRNRFEGYLCGVSIQGCMTSPSYVFQNLFYNWGDEREYPGYNIKTSSHDNGPNAVSFLFNNTVYPPNPARPGRDLSHVEDVGITALNNIFSTPGAISGVAKSPRSRNDYNLVSTADSGPEAHGIVGLPDYMDSEAGLFQLRSGSKGLKHGTPIPNFTPDGTQAVDIGAYQSGSDLVLPERPIPVFLDRYQLHFSPDEVNAAAEKTVEVSVTDNGFASDWRIAQNDDFDWFTVSPDRGMMKSSDKFHVTVKLIPEKMKERSLYSGAFLVRLANGFSRPVTIYARTDYVQPIKPDTKAFVAWIEAETPSGGSSPKVVSDPLASGGKCIELSKTKNGAPIEYRFSVPADDHYIVLMRIRSDDSSASKDALRFSLDDQEPGRCSLRVKPDWSWCMAAQTGSYFTCLQSFQLSAGEHLIRIIPRQSLSLDMIAVTPNPKPFE